MANYLSSPSSTLTKNGETSELVARLQMRLNRSKGLAQLDEVVLKHGYVGGVPFTFQDHEFQREIIKDTSSRVYVRKCSQVGLSELMVQKLLALAVSLQHMRVIMTLPTKGMAQMFSKDRIDGLIDQSDMYSSLVESANNSASQKKIGTCTLYIGGSFGDTSAISVPAETIICDEVDFSNQVVLGKLNSRLRHASIVDEHGLRGLKYMFSTPTVSGYGIDELYQRGTQNQYMVKCEHCEQWHTIDFEKHFFIPGYEGDLRDFSKSDAVDLDLRGTKILCPGCKRDIFNSLCTPKRRQWVPLFPDRAEKSYQVNPWDVPKYNTPFTIVNQISDYPLKSDFYNFVLGLPYSDSDNTFNTGEAYKESVSQSLFISSPDKYMSRTVMGMDVGKTCHLLIGRVNEKGVLEVIYAEKISNSRENPASIRVKELYQQFNVSGFVIDSGPDISLVNEVTRDLPETFASVYVREIKGPRTYEVKNNEPVVNVDRTKSMSLMLGNHNSGMIHYPKNNDKVTDEIFKHLDTTKKIRRQNSDGTFTELFTKKDREDHWVHSLHYLSIAADMKYGVTSTSNDIYAPVTVGRVKIGGGSPFNKSKLPPWRS
jgi:hypothetical protein